MKQILLDLIAPISCVLCGERRTIFCDSHLPIGEPISSTSAGLSGFYVAELEDGMLSLITAFKDRSMTAIARILAEIIQPLIQTDLWGTADLIAIPPSTPSSYRSRGFVPVKLLLAKSKQPKPVLSLRLARKIRDQRTLGAQERMVNLSGAFMAPALRGKKVLLFDDVLTSGATLWEMRRAIELAGGEVLGFCVIARRISDFDSKGFN